MGAALTFNLDGSTPGTPGSTLTTWGSSYQVNTDSGALLLLHGGAKTTSLSCDKRIRDYVLKHIAHWRGFARTRLGIDLEEKDLVFVSGYTKAAEWGTVAFRGARGGSRLLVNGGGFAPGSDEEQWHVTMADAPNAMVFARVGPMDRGKRRWEDPMDVKMDQCIFLQYYRVKTGILRRSLRAGSVGR